MADTVVLKMVSIPSLYYMYLKPQIYLQTKKMIIRDTKVLCVDRHGVVYDIC